MHVQIEAEAPMMRPYGVQQAANALDSLCKAGVAIPHSTTVTLARQAEQLAPYWDLAGASSILGSTHRLVRPTVWEDGDQKETEAAARGMATSVLEAQGGRMRSKQMRTGSWTMVGAPSIHRSCQLWWRFLALSWQLR